MLRDNLIKAFLQGQKLSLDAMQETPVHIQPAEDKREEGGEETQRDHHLHTELMTLRQYVLKLKLRQPPTSCVAFLIKKVNIFQILVYEDALKKNTFSIPDILLLGVL